MKYPVEHASWRALRVWQRNFDVYCATWLVNFIPPLLEPLMYMFAFGFGLGQLLNTVDYNGVQVPYLTFIAPGFIAVAVMNHGFFETTYASFVRMYYQKTFDAILATPLSVEDVILGEIIWGATKSFFAGTIMFAVISSFGLLSLPQSLWIIPVTLFAGFVFSSMGMCFTAVVKSIEMFNFPIFLFITPMFLFSSVFFPLSSLPGWAQVISSVLPLTQLVTIIRELALGQASSTLIPQILALSLTGLLCCIISIKMMRKRLLS